MEIKFNSSFPTLSTTRLTLRKIELDDAEFVHFMRNDSTVNQFVDRPKTESLEDARFFIDTRHQDYFYKRAIYWGLELKTTGFLVGTVALWNLDLEQSRGELGFDLHPSFQRRGLMSEAVKEVLNFGFSMLLLKSIIAITSPENKASCQLLEKLGFQKLATEDLSELDQEAGLKGYELKA